MRIVKATCFVLRMSWGVQHACFAPGKPGVFLPDKSEARRSAFRSAAGESMPMNDRSSRFSSRALSMVSQ